MISWLFSRPKRSQSLTVLKSPSIVNVMIRSFPFQTAKEPLHHRVIPAITLATHTTDHPVLLELTLILYRRILAATIRMYWLMLFLMIADTIDYGDFKLGVRCESVCYSVQTFAVKCSGALTGFLIGAALTLINYVPNQAQTAEAAMSIQLLYLAPSLLYFVAYFIRCSPQDSKLYCLELKQILKGYWK